MIREESKGKKPTLEKLLELPEVISWRALMDTKKAIFSVLESCFQKEGYTAARFQIMFYLYFEGPMSPTQLTKLNMFTKGNTSTFIKRMVADGLIEPIPGNTSNRPFYDLTKKGRAAFEDLFPRHIKRVQKLMLPLDEKTLKQLSSIREKLQLEPNWKDNQSF